MKTSPKHKSVVVLLVFVFGSVVYGQPWDGNGVKGDPYQIWTAPDMQAIGGNSAYWDAHFELMADIDLSAYTGTSFNIIGTASNPFRGVFDGSDNTITNFTYDCDGTNYIGLFGWINDPNAEVKNLGLIAPDVNAGSGYYYAGSLVGLLEGGTISGCYVEGGSVSGNRRVGGLVGINLGGVLSNCHSTCYVSGDNAGGLVGNNEGGTISDCSSSGEVIGTDDVGGLVGRSWDGTISNSYSSASVTGGGDYTGGLIGRADTKYGARISGCYATGNVTGIGRGVGGLVGNSDRNVDIYNSYSSGSVIGDEGVGGLLGYNGGIVVNCYSTGDVLGNSDFGGLVGVNMRIVRGCYWDVETSGQSSSAGGVGKTTVQMQTSSTFIGWGCDEVWRIDDGNDYPRLGWENKQGEIISNPSYGGGSGEPNDPYLIYTAEDLTMVGHVYCDWDKHFKLMADIDLNCAAGLERYAIGDGHVGSFVGTFDGNGKVIYNLCCSPDGTGGGIFGFVDGVAMEIKDLVLIDPNVDDGQHVGSLVDKLNRGIVRNCTVEGGSVSGNSYVGGLIGGCYQAYVSNCRSSANVSGDYCVGGLSGSNGGIIMNCYSSGSISGNGGRGDNRIGGLVGQNPGDISNSYSKANVTGDSQLGGLVGSNRDGEISKCYSIGNVTGVHLVGGLVGYNFQGQVADSFWDVNSSGQASSAGGTGKTTVEMQTESTFTNVGWDFVMPIWKICKEPDYPKLWWEGCPVEVELKLTPQMLNCESHGKWLKAHVILPEEIYPEDIDVNTPAVADPPGIVSEFIEVNEYSDGYYDVQIYFDRQAFCEALSENEEVYLEVTVTGSLTDGRKFEGSDTIQLKSPPWQRRNRKAKH